ncbi:hypothetical protein PTUN_a1686 [Pseudoalteromonas tunicata]|nr:hypothetical protein PTUN_a1686 [Pseudoalteromonas tunicata]
MLSQAWVCSSLLEQNSTIKFKFHYSGIIQSVTANLEFSYPIK